MSRLKNHFMNNQTSFCEICEMVMSPKSLKKHLKHHGIADQTIYKCPNCDYSSKTNLARHLKTCQKEKTKVVHQCPLCPYESETKYLVTRHIRRHHSKNVGEKNHSCLLCGRVFTLKKNLARHMKTIHSNKVETPTLGFALWEDHLTVKSKLAKVYQCEDCGFVTRFKGNLARHEARKHVEIDEKIKSSTCQYYSKKLFSET